MSTHVADSDVATRIQHAVNATVVANDADVVLGGDESLRGPVEATSTILPIVHSRPDVEISISGVPGCLDVPLTFHALAKTLSSNLALILHTVAIILCPVWTAISSIAASDIRLGKSHASCGSSVLACNIVSADVIHTRTLNAATAEIQAKLANLVPAAVLVIPALPSAGGKHRS